MRKTTITLLLSSLLFMSMAIAEPLAADGDTLSFSIGSTLVQSAGHTRNISLRYMENTHQASPNRRPTLSPTPQELADVQRKHERESRYGRFYAGIGYGRLDDLVSAQGNSPVTGFIQWSSR